MTKTKRINDKATLSSFHFKSCIVCGHQGCDPAHIKTKGSGGHDSDDNLMPLCRKHHSEQHSTGLYSFTKKYPQVGIYLELKGWTVTDTNKLIRI